METLPPDKMPQQSTPRAPLALRERPLSCPVLTGVAERLGVKRSSAIRQTWHIFNMAMLAAMFNFCLVGCSTVEPTPEARAAAETRPWAAPTPQAPSEQYPWASLVASLLGAATR
jgi:hypothetical protein